MWKLIRYYTINKGKFNRFFVISGFLSAILLKNISNRRISDEEKMHTLMDLFYLPPWLRFVILKTQEVIRLGKNRSFRRSQRRLYNKMV